VIEGILPSDTINLASGIEIRQENQSLRYYKGSDQNFVAPYGTALPTSVPTIIENGDPTCVFLSDTYAVKWAKYGTNRTPVDGQNNGFGLLLWSGANPRKATFGITIPAGFNGGSSAYSYTVIVDWNGVDF
jgi:hypothetical protein